MQGDGKPTHQITNWSITVPSALKVGDTATLIFDLRNTNDPDGVYFSNREAANERHWWPLQYTVCVGGVCNLYLPAILRNHFVCPEGKELIQNGSFEQGAVLWIEDAPAPIIRDYTPIAPRTGAWAAWLSGYNNAHDELYQDFHVPLGTAYVDINLYVALTTTEVELEPRDHFYVLLDDLQSQQSYALMHISNADEALVWHHLLGPLDLSAWAGQTMRLRFVATSDSQEVTSFVLDDVSFVVHCQTTKATPGLTLTVESPALLINPLPVKELP